MRDERAVAGFLALHLLVAAPGFLLLYALGMLRPRAAAIVAAAGPAFLLGVALLGVPLIALLTLGVEVGDAESLGAVAVVSVLLGAAAVRRRRAGAAAPAAVDRPDEGRDAGPRRAGILVERALLAVIAAYVAFAALSFANLPTSWDDANIWSLRALGLYHHDGLVAEVFRNPEFSYAHLDYPILQPLLEASFFRALGGVDLRLWHLELWVVFAAALWTLAWLLAPLGRRWPWVLVIGLLAVSPVAIANVTLGVADLTMAALLGCGTLALGLWLDRGGLGYALLGAAFLAAAANTKNEGLAFAVAVLVAMALVVLAAGPRRRSKELLVCVGAVMASAAPWALWVSGNPAAERHTPSPWDVAGEPDYLVDRSSFLWGGIEQVAQQMVAGPVASFFVPTFLVTAAVLALVGVARRLAAFYAAAWLLAGLTIAYMYWVTPIDDLAAFEQRTGARVVLGVVLVAAAGLAHLLAVAASVATRSDEDPAPAATPDAVVVP